MKKIFIILLNIVAVLTFLILCTLLIYPYIYFNNMDSQTMNIWIVDKTVPNTEYREHTGLLWFLNSEKIISDKTNDLYEYQKDYYGFFPISIDEFEIKDLPEETEYPDLIYLADTYGVYEDDYFKENKLGTRSELIHGALTGEELVKIKANLAAGNTIIGEFNTASAPTNRENRDHLGEIFRMEWTGWSGRYFKDLTEGIEVPVWAVKSYEENSGLKWEFGGEGIILVSDNDIVLVFEKDKDFGDEYIYLEFDEKYYDEFGIDKQIPYDYWFEFTVPNQSAEILANYTIDVTESGRQKLSKIGLNSTFPAIVRNKNTQYTSYYFAGDFADGDITYKWWNFYGFRNIKKIFPAGEKGDNSKFYWRCYIPMMDKITDDIKDTIALKGDKYTLASELKYNVRTTTDSFEFNIEGTWEEQFIKGVNIGSSTPGKWFTQFETSESFYLEWIEQIADMNANTIRIYTLLPPQFYSAFVYYNEQNPDKPLWLYQEIWPEENPQDDDYLAEEYNKEYIKEIEYVVDALNGRANIPYRFGRAYGIYTSDVSPYLAGYLVGRELEPEEVISTNEKNEHTQYNGTYLYCTSDASPTEAWLAMCCDYLLEYEEDEYNWQHPVGIVSWTTLDIAEHDSEWSEDGDKDKQYNDRVSVDINNIRVKEALLTGFFGAYHIYPNYPDFMNNETKYAEYMDEQGVFRYGGYLKEFMSTHSEYPALVAEFGISTGAGNAHSSPDGYNHGGLSEAEQGEGIIRMMEAMKRENYAGGIIFEWADEWAKKTWTTEPYIIPFERNVLWHNVLDPEQNYGIIAMEAGEIRSDEYTVLGEGKIRNIELSADEEYLFIDVTFDKKIDFLNEELFIGIDTYDRHAGNFKYSDEYYVYSPIGMEFVVNIKNVFDAKLQAIPSYNVSNGSYMPTVLVDGVFEDIEVLINAETTTKDGTKIEAIYENNSILDFGKFENNRFNTLFIDDNKIMIRIPWMLINFSDPSDMRILYDNEIIHMPLKDQIGTLQTDGILISAVMINKKDGKILGSVGNKEQELFLWDSWDVPNYTTREKTSYDILREYFE